MFPIPAVAAAAIGVMGGEIDYLFIAYGDVYDLIESGDLKPLACTGESDKIVTMADDTEITIPTLDGEKPEIAETTNKLAMWAWPFLGPPLPNRSSLPAGMAGCRGFRRV